MRQRSASGARGSLCDLHDNFLIVISNVPLLRKPYFSYSRIALFPATTFTSMLLTPHCRNTCIAQSIFCSSTGPKRRRSIPISVWRSCRFRISADCWKDVHPLLATIPVDWDFTMPYGLIYAKEPSKELLQFIMAIGNILN